MKKEELSQHLTRIGHLIRLVDPVWVEKAQYSALLVAGKPTQLSVLRPWHGVTYNSARIIRSGAYGFYVNCVREGHGPIKRPVPVFWIAGIRCYIPESRVYEWLTGPVGAEL
jgi:hypothetical protein